MDKIKKAIIFANITAVILVIIKVFAGWLTGSLAVLSSALDSTLDFGVSLFNLYIFKRSSTKNNENYNYGQGKIQGIGAVLEGSIVGLSGITLIYFALEKILQNKGVQEVNASIFMMGISIVITGILVWYLTQVARENNNLTLRSDMLHYKTDLWTNAGIIFSLILIKITGFQILDSIVSIMIGAYILLSSKGIILEGFHMLMDRKIEDKFINGIIEIIQQTDERVNGYHYLKTRKSGDDVFIDVHLVFNKDIKLLDAHTIGDKIEFKIMKLIPNASVNIHLDPFDDSNKNYCKI